MPDVENTIVRLIAVELKISEARVRDANSLKKDLHMDSIAAANLLFALEEEYGIEMDLDGIEHLDSVTDIQRVITRSLPAAT